jgi:hypothetical protein
MSRHYLSPLDTNTIDEVVVGYDVPMRELFAQVWTVEAEGDFADCPTHELSGTLDADQIVTFVKPYAHIPPTLRDELAAEAIHNSGMNQIVRYPRTPE